MYNVVLNFNDTEILCNNGICMNMKLNKQVKVTLTRD